MRRTLEGRRDRMVLARDAGLGRVSIVSALAGTMVAYGTTTVLLALVSGIAARAGTGTSITTYDWERIGFGAAIALGVVLLLSYLFGGYVAGRMARRAGSANGILVFVLGLVVVALAALVIGTETDKGTVVDGLRRSGVPTTGDEWSAIGTIAGLVSLVAMLVGSVLGGVLGERWHGKLLARAMDPDLGPEADARRAEAEARARREGPTGYATRVRGDDGADDRDVDALDDDDGDRRGVKPRGGDADREATLAGERRERPLRARSRGDGTEAGDGSEAGERTAADDVGSPRRTGRRRG